MPEVRFRWAVGDPLGAQSPPWTLTVRGSEFVLALRTPRQRWHVTFHESGERHMRFDSAASLAQAGGVGAGRDADSWLAPDPIGGVVGEFMLLVPTDELRKPAMKRRTEKLAWIEPAAPGEVLRLVIERRPPKAASVGAVWSALLANGQTVAIVVVRGPLNRVEAVEIARTRTELARHGDDARSLSDPAGFQWGHSSDRMRFWIAMAPEGRGSAPAPDAGAR